MNSICRTLFCQPMNYAHTICHVRQSYVPLWCRGRSGVPQKLRWMPKYHYDGCRKAGRGKCYCGRIHCHSVNVAGPWCCSCVLLPIRVGTLIPIFVGVAIILEICDTISELSCENVRDACTMSRVTGIRLLFVGLGGVDSEYAPWRTAPSLMCVSVHRRDRDSAATATLTAWWQ